MFDVNMSNTKLQYNLKLYYRARIKHNSVLLHLDPGINTRKLYTLYIKNNKYYKAYYLYLYYVYLLLIGTL